MKKLCFSLTLSVLVLCLCGFFGFGGDTSTAKNMVLPGISASFEKTVNKYRYFKKIEWKEEKSQTGKQYIVMSAEYDLLTVIKDNESLLPKLKDLDGINISDLITGKLDSIESAIPVFIKFYFLRLENNAFQRDYISRLYANMPHVRDETLKKMENNELVLLENYEIIFNSELYIKEAKNIANVNKSNFISIIALNQINNNEPISDATKILDNILYAYSNIQDQKREAAIIAEKIDLNNDIMTSLEYNKNRQNKFISCRVMHNTENGTIVSGSVFAINEIMLPITFDTYSRGQISIAEMNYFLPLGNSEPTAHGGDAEYSIASAEKSPSGKYVIRWEGEGKVFSLRWSDSADLTFSLTRSGFREDIKYLDENMEPKDIFMRFCVPQTEVRNISGKLTLSQDKSLYHIVSASGESLASFPVTSKQFKLFWGSSSPWLGETYNCEFVFLKDTNQIANIKSFKPAVVEERFGSMPRQGRQESSSAKNTDQTGSIDYFINLHANRSKAEIEALFQRTTNRSEKEALRHLYRTKQ